MSAVAHAAAFLTLQARAGEYLSVLKGSVTSTLLDAGLLFLLRFALDDGVEGVMSAAVHALKALLVCAEDEVRQLEASQRVIKTSSLFLIITKYVRKTQPKT